MEERLSCAIVRDLLPLYNDGVLEKESADAVEAHLKNCRECALMLEKLNRSFMEIDKISEPQKMPSAETVLQDTKRFSFKKGVLLASAVGVAVIGVFITVFCPVWKTPEDTFKISQVYLGENDGEFAQTFQEESDKEITEMFTGEGKYRFTVQLRKEQYSGAHKVMERDGDTVIIKETYPLYKSYGSHPVVEETVSFAVDRADEIQKVVYNGKAIWNIDEMGQPEIVE